MSTDTPRDDALRRLSSYGVVYIDPTVIACADDDIDVLLALARDGATVQAWLRRANEFHDCVDAVNELYAMIDAKRGEGGKY